MEGEGLGLCSHAPKAVEKPENTAQSDVNKQVLHILLSQIFRSLKRIGRVIESSQRQLYPVLPALTQLITQSFTWQVDRVMHFHMGEQVSNKALQREHHKKPLILTSTSWERKFHSFFALCYHQAPDKTAFQHQKPIFFHLLNLTFSLRNNRNGLSCVKSLVLFSVFPVHTLEDVVLDVMGSHCQERIQNQQHFGIWKIIHLKIWHLKGMQWF